MKKTLALLAALICAPFALAANPYADTAKAEVLHGWTNPDGSRTAALRITLADGWKTYWRAPGDAGIPPQFDWSRARNLENVTLHWPRPVVFDQNGMRSIGYKRELVLPMVLSPKRAGKPIRLTGAVDIGVCLDICVPLRLELDEMIRPASSAPDQAIKAALARAPLDAAEAGASGLSCETRKGSDGLILTMTLKIAALGGREEAAIETGDPLVWAKEPDVSRQGDRISITSEFVHALGGAFALDRSALRVTLLGSERAIDIQGCG